MRSVTLVTCLALAGSLAALPSPLIAQKPVDPCSLLTAQDVSGVLGIKSLPGRPWMGTSKASCFYSADTTYELTARTATLMILPTGGFEAGKQMSTKGPLAGKSAGVGDDSYYMSFEHYAKLEVRKGTHEFTVTVTPGPGQTTIEQVGELEKALAKEAVAKL
ncbi:MAG: hypothetical protein ACJ8DJ_12355 [Gemmatimonadales bacterium]|jgi:hypothetical protein